MLPRQMLLGQISYRQMLTVQMSPRQLTTHTDGLTIQPSKFGWVLTSNSGDMASYLLRNSIIFKLGQMLYRQMLTVQMSLRQLTTHTDGLTIKPSKFGWVLTSNSGYMASYLLLNYRDPKKRKFCKTSSRHCSLKSELGSVGKLGLQSNWL